MCGSVVFTNKTEGSSWSHKLSQECVLWDIAKRDRLTPSANHFSGELFPSCQEGNTMLSVMCANKVGNQNEDREDLTEGDALLTKFGTKDVRDCRLRRLQN